jgi:hypothetical protein
MTLTPAEITALDAGAVGSLRLGLFLRLDVDPPLRCWLGLGSIRPGVNAIDATDELYSGFGQLLAVPAFQQLVNGAAERAEISLSGVDPRILDLATEANAVRGKSCDIGVAIFDSNWSLIGPVHWMRHFVADFMSVTVTPAADPGGQTMHSAKLSIGSMMTGRRKRGLSYFSNQDQHERSPTDNFCERTRLYTMNGQKQWPKYA